MPLAIALAASQCINFAQMFHFDNTFPPSQTHRASLCVEKDDFAVFEATLATNLPKTEKFGSCFVGSSPTSVDEPVKPPE